MATTWSQNAWGDNSWNTDLNTISVSGIPVSFDLGQANYTPISGWDAYSWGQGNWGEIPNSDIIVTGLSATFNLGEVTQTSSSGWGRSTWGSSIWNGYGTVLPTGVSANLILVM
jgi:hypothetical protein